MNEDLLPHAIDELLAAVRPKGVHDSDHVPHTLIQRFHSLLHEAQTAYPGRAGFKQLELPSETRLIRYRELAHLVEGLAALVRVQRGERHTPQEGGDKQTVKPGDSLGESRPAPEIGYRGPTEEPLRAVAADWISLLTGIPALLTMFLAWKGELAGKEDTPPARNVAFAILATTLLWLFSMATLARYAQRRVTPGRFAAIHGFAAGLAGFGLFVALLAFSLDAILRPNQRLAFWIITGVDVTTWICGAILIALGWRKAEHSADSVACPVESK